MMFSVTQGRVANIVAAALLASALTAITARPASSEVEPVVIRWATYLGGESSESALAVGGGPEGSVTFGGYTFGAGFPTGPAAVQDGPSGAADAVVATLAREGAELAYASYLGGISQDAVHGLAVDETGAVYLVGETHSPDFPATSGIMQPGWAGGQDAFVAKFAADGSGLAWATYLGGEGYDIALAADIGADGSLYVTGRTSSDDFPTTSNAIRRTLSGRTDIFIARISPDGARLEYGTLFGGSNTDARPTSGEAGRAIAVDDTGAVYIAGVTDSSDLPTGSEGPPSGRPLGVVNGGGFGDAFAAKIVPGEAEPSWSGYLGGIGSDTAYALEVDEDGVVYAAGGTESPDFPVFMAGQTTHGGFGSFDGWVARIESGGAGLGWSRFLGGRGNEVVNGLARNEDGTLWLSGRTTSDNFPVSSDALQPAYAGGGGDGFLVRMEPDGSALRYGTFLGGAGDDAVSGLARVNDDTVLVAGRTSSVDFPVSPGALQPENAGGVDAFVASIGPPLPSSCWPPGPPPERPPHGPPPGPPSC